MHTPRDSGRSFTIRNPPRDAIWRVKVIFPGLINEAEISRYHCYIREFSPMDAAIERTRDTELRDSMAGVEASAAQ